MNGREFAALRHAGRMTQKDLAESTGVSPTAIAEFETGKRDIRVSTLQKLLSALGAEANYTVAGITITARV